MWDRHPPKMETLKEVTRDTTMVIPNLDNSVRIGGRIELSEEVKKCAEDASQLS